MAILDDVCASQHGQKAGADQNLKGIVWPIKFVHVKYHDNTMSIHPQKSYCSYNCENTAVWRGGGVGFLL